MAKENIIQTLIGDVERLMKLHDDAMVEIEALRAKNEDQNKKIRTLQKELKDTQKALSEQSLRQAMGGSSANKAAAKAQINRLLREVDKCIVMVSKRI